MWNSLRTTKAWGYMYSQGLKVCPSLVVERRYYYCRYISPTVRGKISIVLLGSFLSVTVICFLYNLDSICVISG